MNSYIIERKPYDKRYDDSSKYSEFWNGDDAWNTYEFAKHYYELQDAMSIAATIANDCNFYYDVLEVDETGFVICEYEV